MFLLLFNVHIELASFADYNISCDNATNVEKVIETLSNSLNTLFE